MCILTSILMILQLSGLVKMKLLYRFLCESQWNQWIVFCVVVRESLKTDIFKAKMRYFNNQII